MYEPNMEKLLLVEYISNTVKTVICETFKSMQRVKLTSFDVSPLYIIFGASSGGIYIFKRTPCEFLRIVPSKEGSTIHALISPNEKNLAVASAKGLVIVLENFFMDMTLRPLIHIEHEGNTLTAMKWHGNDLYCGDDKGKISVFTIATQLTKAIFQIPSVTLMQLDSSIVQLDNYKHYLLISTKTRTYLCDTDKEQFKQIGKKMRDGNFGACFFHNSNATLDDTHHSSRTTFKTMKDDEKFCEDVNNGDTKIFCSRPGARVWQANFEATVLATYQFRDTLNQGPSDVVLIDSSDDAKLTVTTHEKSQILDNFRFGKLYLFCEKFIFTYDSEGIYFFEPTITNAAFWSPAFKNISDIKILNSYIYVWCNGLHLHTISLQSLEHLLISTLMKNQYYLCAELCLYFENDVRSLLECSEKLHLLRRLNLELVEIGAYDSLEKLKPILDMLAEKYKEQNSEIKLTNRIPVDENCDIDLPTTVKNLDQSTLVRQNPLNNIGDNGEGKRYVISIYKQYLLNKTHRTAELTETSNIFNTLNLDNVLKLLNDFTEYVQERYNESASNWCQEQLLKQALKREIVNINKETLLCLTEAIFIGNSTKKLCCQCNFPLPNAHSVELGHYKLAYSLYDMSYNKTEFLKKVPQLYKHKLMKLSNHHDIILNLPILTQFSDKEVFKEHLCSITYDNWEEIVKLYMKLRHKLCLNCGVIIHNRNTMTWAELGMLIIESVGADNANRLIKRYAHYIPNGELDEKFYQACIFTSTCEEPRTGIHYMENVVNDETCQKFGELMGKFLKKKYIGNQPNLFTKLSSSESIELCSYCKLSLKGPILIDIKTCDRGHKSHSICFLHSSNICNMCLLGT